MEIIFVRPSNNVLIPKTGCRAEYAPRVDLRQQGKIPPSIKALAGVGEDAGAACCSGYPAKSGFGVSDAALWESRQGRSCNPSKVPDFLGKVRERCRVRRLSIRTEQAYMAWAWRFVRANHGVHPRRLGKREVEAFLTRLATDAKVAASTQNQALSALLFLYREVLCIQLPWMEEIVRAKRPRRLPVVLSREEVMRLLTLLDGQSWLQAALLYGAGLRLMECLRLRVQDVDFDRH